MPPKSNKLGISVQILPYSRPPTHPFPWSLQELFSDGAVTLLFVQDLPREDTDSVTNVPLYRVRVGLDGQSHGLRNRSTEFTLVPLYRLKTSQCHLKRRNGL